MTDTSCDEYELPSGLDTSRPDRNKPATTPGCFLKGTGGFLLKYKVEDSTLYGTLTVIIWNGAGEKVYERNYPKVPKEGQVELTGFVLSGYIDRMRFRVAWAGSGSLFTDFHVYVVLDKPKAPMDPAWVTVLNISCAWARGESTWKGAANKLTLDVFSNRCRYDGYRWFHHFEGWQDTEIGKESTEETFHLKHFLDHGIKVGIYEGNCNALANFLCCLMTSVGINAIVQRTNRIILYKDGVKGGRWTFRTKQIHPAGWIADKYYAQWGYHQIALIEVEGNRIWDGSLIFMDPVSVPLDMVRENPPPSGVEFGSRAHWEADGCKTYFCKLVDFNAPYKPPPNEEGTHPDYRWETNHPNTKLTPPKLKVTTIEWKTDGCF